MKPDLIHASNIGDFEEAAAALKSDPACIYQTNEYDMNALQLAIAQFHKNFAFFLLENTEITTRHKDKFQRDALDMAIIAAGEELCVAVNDRWHKERSQEIEMDPLGINRYWKSRNLV